MLEYHSSIVASLTDQERLVLEWHRANLEMSNGADLDLLSNAQWDQDDMYAFLGDHSAVIACLYDFLCSLHRAKPDICQTEHLSLLNWY